MIGVRWCSDCLERTSLILPPFCQLCGLPQADSGQCSGCSHERPIYDRMRSFGRYQGPLKKALRRLKYRRDLGLGEALARQLKSLVDVEGWKIDEVVPIPLGDQRFRERGYNQVSLFALPLALSLGLSYSPGILVRKKDTPSQVGLSRLQRRLNVKDAFEVAETQVTDRNILLLDDVTTTGATLQAATRAFKHGGANSVTCLTLARVVDQDGSFS